MRNLISIFAILVLINFLILPSIAKCIDFDFSSQQVSYSEEEHTYAHYSLYEEELMTHNSIFFDIECHDISLISNASFEDDNCKHISPYLPITSPPPESYFI